MSKKEEKKQLISKSDIVLLIAIVLIAVAAIAFFMLSSKQGAAVQISIDGEIVDTFSMDEDLEYEAYTELGKNLVQIKNGEVSVISADCPDKVCVNHKPVKNVGEVIICLPHKLVVEIVEQ